MTTTNDKTHALNLLARLVQLSQWRHESSEDNTEFNQVARELSEAIQTLGVSDES